MWRTILLLLILWPHSYQLHWPLVLVLRETEQSIPIHLLHATHDFMDHYHVPSCYSFFHAEESHTTLLFCVKKLFHISDQLLSCLVQPWSYAIAIYSSLSCSLLLLLLLPSSSHQIANFWVRQHLKMEFFSQNMHQLAIEIYMNSII